MTRTPQRVRSADLFSTQGLFLNPVTVCPQSSAIAHMSSPARNVADDTPSCRLAYCRHRDCLMQCMPMLPVKQPIRQSAHERIRYWQLLGSSSYGWCLFHRLDSPVCLEWRDLRMCKERTKRNSTSWCAHLGCTKPALSSQSIVPNVSLFRPISTVVQVPSKYALTMVQIRFGKKGTYRPRKPQGSDSDTDNVLQETALPSVKRRMTII
jgi:hypothetical protein